MTHPSSRFRILAQLTACASCLCLAFACGGTTENDADDDKTNGPATDSGPTNSGGSGGNTTTGGGDGGNTTTGGTGGGGTASDCPSLEPAEGSGCSVDAQVCDYANCTAPDYRDAHTLSCKQGAWQLTALEACDNVPTTCPPSIYRGAYCDVPEGTGPCSVVDACGAVRNTYCTNGVWEYGDGDGTGEDAAPIIPGSGGAGTGPSATVTTSAPPEPQCPAVQPGWGTACCPAEYPAYCDYTSTTVEAAVGFPSAATGGEAYTAVSGTGFGSGGGPTLFCSACTDMTWQPSTACP